jgi:hypothetical protein
LRKFTFLAGGTEIGWSELELGDPPMGVALGRFHPSERYSPPHASIKVRTPDGLEMEATGGVCILDGSDVLGPEAIEVSVLGIVSPAYDALFPEHVAAYQAQFRARS